MLYPRLVRAEITQNIYPTRDKYGGMLTTIPNTGIPHKKYEISETVLPDDPSCGDLSYKQDVIWFLAAGHGYRDVKACQLENGRTGVGEVKSKGDIAYRVSRGKVKRSAITVYERPVPPMFDLTWKPVPYLFISETLNNEDYSFNSAIYELNEPYSFIYIYPLQTTPDRLNDVFIGDVIDVNNNSNFGLEPILYRTGEHSNFFPLISTSSLTSVNNVSFASNLWGLPVTGFAIVLSEHQGISNFDKILFYGRTQTWDGTNYTPVTIPPNTPSVNLQFIDLPQYFDPDYSGVISFLVSN